MRPLELPISAATSRTVVAARPFRRATARAASTIASRRRSADMRAIADTVALLRKCPIRRYHARHRPGGAWRTGHGGERRLDDPDDPVPRADERPERDRPVGALVELPRRAALPDVREVRVLRDPDRGRHVRHLA